MCFCYRTQMQTISSFFVVFIGLKDKRNPLFYNTKIQASPNDRFGIKNKRFYFGIVFVFTIFANIKVKQDR